MSIEQVHVNQGQTGVHGDLFNDRKKGLTVIVFSRPIGARNLN